MLLALPVYEMPRSIIEAGNAASKTNLGRSPRLQSHANECYSGRRGNSKGECRGRIPFFGRLFVIARAENLVRHTDGIVTLAMPSVCVQRFYAAFQAFAWTRVRTGKALMQGSLARPLVMRAFLR